MKGIIITTTVMITAIAMIDPKPIMIWASAHLIIGLIGLALAKKQRQELNTATTAEVIATTLELAEYGRLQIEKRRGRTYISVGPERRAVELRGTSFIVRSEALRLAINIDRQAGK